MSKAYPCGAGIGLMGGAMLRDFAIVATAYGASFASSTSKPPWLVTEL